MTATTKSKQIERVLRRIQTETPLGKMMYGNAGGGRGIDPIDTYDNTAVSNAIPKEVEKYKDSDSRNRVRRSMEGGENKPETDSEKAKLDDITKGKSSEYSWDLFNDFMKFGLESQPEGTKRVREAGMTYSPREGIRNFFGDNKTSRVEMDLPSDAYNGFNIHSHPPHNYELNPSNKDRENSKVWGQSYLMEHGNNSTLKYGKHGKDVNNLLNLLYEKNIKTP